MWSVDPRALRMIRLARRHAALCAYVFFSCTLYFGSFGLHGPKVVVAPFLVNDPAIASLDLVKSIIALAGSLATALFAGVAAIVLKSGDVSDSLNAFDRAMLVGALACGVLTYYGVYCAYIATLSMLAAGAFSPLANDVSTAVAIQYYGVLAGALMLGITIARIIDRRAASQKP
jgi:hypothetical protein